MSASEEVSNVPAAAEVEHVSEEANSIATFLIQALVKQFEAKTGRAPTEDEVEELMAELTEDRINNLLNGLEDKEEDGEGEEEGEGEGEAPKENEEEPVAVLEKRELSGAAESSADKRPKANAVTDENIAINA